MFKGRSVTSRALTSHFIEALEDRRLLSTSALDAAFGSGGKVKTNFAAVEYGTDLAIDSSGRLYVSGWVNSQFSLTRYSPSGAVDTTFGNGKGYVQPPLPVGMSMSRGEAVLIQPDGKILIGGTYWPADMQSAAVGVARFTSTGQLDSTWDGDGQLTTIFPTGSADARLAGMAVQADGKVLITDHQTESILRFNTNGSVDSTFDPSGLLKTNLKSSTTAVALQSDGKILVLGGGSTVSPRRGGPAIARLNPDGSPDMSFDQDGSSQFLVDGTQGMIENILQLKDNRIIVVGNLDNQMAAYMFNADGTPAANFGNNGAIRLLGGKETKSFDVAQFPDGRIAISGSYTNILGTAHDFAFWVIKPDGTPDASVGIGGRITTDFGADDESTGMVIQPDGKVAIAGFTQRSTDSDTILARYTFPSTAGGSIAGGVYNDVNGNGVRDAGESGIGGITVYNDANNNNILDSGELTTLSGPTGAYSFGALPAASYKIRQILQTGWSQTTPASNYGWTITLAANQSVTTKDFGTRTTGAVSEPAAGVIAGEVFDDLDGDGFQDMGEGVVAGTTVYIDANNNSQFDTGEQSSIVSTYGFYSLTGLIGGTYKVRQVVPTDRDQTTPAANAAWTITIAGNQTIPEKNFGSKVRPATTGTSVISGNVWDDLDGNGMSDPTEKVTGRTVYIDSNHDGNLTAGEPTAVTANGSYRFGNLPPGTYYVREVVPSGWRIRTPALGEWGLSFTADGTQWLTINFVNERTPTTGSISGSVFNDLDGDGFVDLNETGLAGITIYNDANNNASFDPGELTTTTDSNGAYTFSAIAAGGYTIRQVLQSGWSQTKPAPSVGWAVSLAGGQTVTAKDFGTKHVSGNSAIGGTIWDDLNGNGATDASELVSGRTVYIDSNHNAMLDEGERTTTTSNGQYLFDNLLLGAYDVREVIPAGWRVRSPAQGYWTVDFGVDGTDLNADIVNERIPGGGSIAGTVFNDLDGDGVKDTNEVGVANITVYNDANNNSKLDAGELTATTDSGGAYILGGLSAASYKIRQVLQSGWSQTSPANGYGWTVTLSSGQQLTGKNFGTKQSTVATGAKISGMIFNDLDGDGIKDSNEVGVGSGWKVYIDLDNDDVLDSNELYTTTDANGNWTLSGLTAGTYKVRQVLQTGWKQTTPTNNYGLNVTLSTNQSVSGKSFGSKKIA